MSTPLMSRPSETSTVITSAAKVVINELRLCNAGTLSSAVLAINGNRTSSSTEKITTAMMKATPLMLTLSRTNAATHRPIALPASVKPSRMSVRMKESRFREW